MDFGVLGPLQVVQGGRNLTPRGRLQRAVLLRLLLDANKVVPADLLAEHVFDGDQPPKKPAAAIQVHVSRLRKALAGATGEADELIAGIPPGYLLCIGPHDVDSWRFERLVNEAAVAMGQGKPDAAAERLVFALALWRGPPLGDFNYSTWAQAEVARLEDLHLGAVESLFEARLALGGHHEVVSQLRAMAGEHPMRERLWAQLMRALYLDGRQAEALRAYQQARRALDEGFGLSPCRELQDLEQAILRQDPALHQVPSVCDDRRMAKVLRHSQAEVHVLPRPLTRFVGRETATAELTTTASMTRLLTLTGMAGVGKTRLALEVASNLVEAAPTSAVRLVELASVSEPNLVVAAVSAAIGPRQDGDVAAVETLARAIGEREFLILLDNCEHLRDACAEVAITLLARCPNLRILATSQEVLGVPGEAAWQVPPLSLPMPDVAEPCLDHLLREESVQLFCDRAALVRPGFALSAENCEAVSTICRRLDGVPLAIELAAAAVAMLSVREISALLDDRFNVLTTGSRWVTGRHRTLLAAVDWSHNLLSRSEQILLRRLAVFAGGATLGAVEEVCADDQVPPSDIFEHLSGLVTKSLVVADTGGRQACYRLLETIRFFAADRLLESGEQATVAGNHLRWCVGLAERAEPELTGADEQAWRERLRADHDNLRAALQWAVADGRGDLALRLSAALALFWVRTGQGHEGRDWLERSLAISSDQPVGLRARALWGLGQVCLQVGDLSGAAGAAAKSLALWQSSGEAMGQARALLVLACSGSADQRRGLEEAANLARQAGDRWCLSQSLVVSGWSRLGAGHLRLAQACFDEAVAVARQAQGRFELIPGLIGLGATAVTTGDYQIAEPALEEAEVLCRGMNVPREGTSVLCWLAELEMGRGDHDAPRALLGEALKMALQLGNPGLEIQCHLLMGRLALELGDTNAAEASFEQARSVIERMGRTSSAVLVGLAEARLAKGDARSAKTQLADAFALARAGHDTLGLAKVVFRLGDVAAVEDDLDQAVACHRWALSQRAAVDNLPGVVRSLDSLASLAISRGDPRHAARLFGASQSLRTTGGYVRPPAQQPVYETALAQLQKRLPKEALATAWSDGAHLLVTDAVACALGEESSA